MPVAEKMPPLRGNEAAEEGMAVTREGVLAVLAGVQVPGGGTLTGAT